MTNENTNINPDTITVTINGSEKSFPLNITVRELLTELNLANQAVAVEINRNLIPKKNHQTHHLNPGDCIELLTLVGGG